LLDVGIHRGAEAPTQQAQQHRTFTLPAALPATFLVAFLAALLDELLSGCHDGFLGFGSEFAFEERLERFSFDVVVDLEM